MDFQGNKVDYVHTPCVDYVIELGTGTDVGHSRCTLAAGTAATELPMGLSVLSGHSNSHPPPRCNWISSPPSTIGPCVTLTSTIVGGGWALQSDTRS
jgi:hypothetical protein